MPVPFRGRGDKEQRPVIERPDKDPSAHAGPQVPEEAPLHRRVRGWVVPFGDANRDSAVCLRGVGLYHPGPAPYLVG